MVERILQLPSAVDFRAAAWVGWGTRFVHITKQSVPECVWWRVWLGIIQPVMHMRGTTCACMTGQGAVE